MPGRQPDKWGITLWEAIERWTPKELWGRYQELAEHETILRTLGREDPRSEEVRRLRSQIAGILIGRLTRGELIASGIALPLTETSRRRDIRPELWPFLSFTWRFRTATDGGLTYAEIRIREASSARDEPPERRQDALRAQVSRHRASRPAGRPSIMPMIEAEMRRRASAGLIEKSLRREAEALEMWAGQQFADAHVPKPESIQKKLGRVYKELNRTKRGDK